MLTSGIRVLHEGSGISSFKIFPPSFRETKYNTLNPSPKLELLGMSTANVPALMFCNLSGDPLAPNGRLVIDGGVTKFFEADKYEGIVRYASNFTIWLLGLDYQISHSLLNWPKSNLEEKKMSYKVL